MSWTVETENGTWTGVYAMSKWDAERYVMRMTLGRARIISIKKEDA